MRSIDFNKPLSEDDKTWLRQRDRHAEIDANEKRFYEEPDDEDAVGEGSESPADDYDRWKAAELKEHAASFDPPIEIQPGWRKADLVAAIRERHAA